MKKYKLPRKKYLVIALLLVHQLGKAGSPFPPPLSSHFPRMGHNAALVVAMRDQAGVAIVGKLSPQVVSATKRLLNEQRDVKALYIDSEGGDMGSGIALAELVRDRKIRVIVAGSCLSACANYVFAAAKVKDVLPGSLIGIHENVFRYAGKDTVNVVGASDKKLLAGLSGDTTVPHKIAELVEIEKAFYKRNGISTAHHQAFSDYLGRRKVRLLSKTTVENCPAVDFWILRRRELERMGVSGMGATWTPKNTEEAREAGVRLGLEPRTIFVGSILELSELCKPATGFLSKFRSMLGGT